MSTYEYDSEVFGDGGFSIGYGKGFGGDGERPYHFILDVFEDDEKSQEGVVVAMTPEDAVHLAMWLVDWAKVVKEMESEESEDCDCEDDDDECEEDGHVEDERIAEVVDEMDRRIPSARECENHCQSLKHSDVVMTMKEGYNIPLPPSRSDVLNVYTIMRRMGYTPEQLAQGKYSLMKGPE